MGLRFLNEKYYNAGGGERMSMFKRKTNSDLERLEGGRLMSLDRFMTLLCYRFW